VDRSWDDLSVDLLLRKLLNMNRPSLPVDCQHLTSLSLMLATHDSDLIALADRDGSDTVFLTELSAQVA
jgi:hypothetical protein